MAKLLHFVGITSITLGLVACGGGGSSSGSPSNSSSSSTSSSLAVSTSSSSSSVPSSLSSSSASNTSSPYSANVEQLHGLASFPIGVGVSNNDAPSFNILTSTREQAVVTRHFNQMTAGNIMKMSYLQPSRGNFTFANADAFVDYAQQQGMSIHGHALVWHSDYQVPNFMKNWTGTSEDFLTAVDEHITGVMNHYNQKDNVISWDVVNEAIDDATPANFRSDSAFYKHSGNSAVYIERAFQAAAATGTSATLYYNDYNIEQNNAKTTKLINMVDDFIARDIPIGGIGFQMHICLNYPTAAAIGAALKKAADTGLMVKITELDIAINQPYCDNYPTNKVSQFSESTALVQKKRYCDIAKAYSDNVPAAQRGGISVWGTTDANTWLDSLYSTQFNNEKISWPLLFDNNYNDKPALRGLADGLLGSACSNTH